MEAAKQCKKQWRKENKANKMKALLNISTLNEKERQEIAAFKSGQPLETNCLKTEEVSDNHSDSSIEPKHKKRRIDEESLPSVSTNSDPSPPDAPRPTFTEAERAELRLLLKKRRALLKRTPNLRLSEVGYQAELNVSASDRIPIFCSDIQDLVMKAVLKRDFLDPRWINIDSVGSLNAVQILFVEGVGINDYLKHEKKLTSLSESNTQARLEVIMPAAYGGDLIEEFCSVPLSNSQGRRLINEYQSLENVVQQSKCQLFKIFRVFFPIKKAKETEERDENEIDTEERVKEEKLKKENMKEEKIKDVKEENEKKETKKKSSECEGLPSSLPSTDKFSRTCLLLSAGQMIEEGYPLPLNDKLKKHCKGYVYTKSSYKEVNNFSPMYAVDCEMCFTTRRENELTRVSILNEKLETIYDELVMPRNKIINYLTQYSGITPAMLRNVETRLEDVQKFIRDNLEPDAILVGQSLNSDLHALKMIHPYCIDTSVIFNVTGRRKHKTKLKTLSEMFLKEKIQKEGRKGHDSVEDSAAALKLVQLKLSKCIEFGDQVLSGEIFQPDKGIEIKVDLKSNLKDKERKVERKLERKLKEDVSGYAISLFHHISVKNQQVSVTGCSEVVEKYVDYVNANTLSCKEVNRDGSCTTLVEPETPKDQVTCYVAQSNDDVMKQNDTHNFLSIYHIALSEHEKDALLDGDDSTVERINQWASQLKESAAVNSLSVVVFCGREMSSNGVCFIHMMKSQGPQRVTVKPAELCNKL